MQKMGRVSSGLSAHQQELQSPELICSVLASSPHLCLFLCVSVRTPFLFRYLSFFCRLGEFVGSADRSVKKNTVQRRWEVYEVLAGYSTVLYLQTTSQCPVRSLSQPHGCTVLSRYSSSWDSINRHADFSPSD